MKNILTTVAVSALLVTSASFASSGTIAPGPAQCAKISGNAPNLSHVNINDRDRGDIYGNVYITVYLDGTTLIDKAYTPIKQGMWHVDFPSGRHYLNMQAACYPGGRAVVGKAQVFDGETFEIPYGVCSSTESK